MRVRVLTVAATVVALAGVLPVTAGTASAAPVPPPGASACYNNPGPGTCDNTDPFDTGCSVGAYTAASANVVGDQRKDVVGVIELRYSPHCGTNWARFTKTGSQAGGPAGVDTCLGTAMTHCSDYYRDYASPMWGNQIYARTTVATAWGDFAFLPGYGIARGHATA